MENDEQICYHAAFDEQCGDVMHKGLRWLIRRRRATLTVGGGWLRAGGSRADLVAE